MRESGKAFKFKQLYEAHWHMVYAYVYNVIADQEQAKDIVQEIFINLWDRFDSLDIKSPKSYLIQAARYQSAKHFKKHQFTHLQIDSVIDILSKPEEEYPREEAEVLLHKISHKAELLPNRCKQVFEMRFYHQLSNKEIAEKLGVSVSTVENQINKALGILRVSFSHQTGILLILASLA